jgi:BioD-like phosphotransacetylase family protein
MRTVYITSTDYYAGKGWISLVLLRKLKSRGINAGYFHPIGTLPKKVKNVLVDEVAVYIKQTVPLDNVEENTLSPVVLTPELAEIADLDIESARKKFASQIFNSYNKLRSIYEFIVISSSGSLFTTGANFNLSAPEIANLLDVKHIVVISKYSVEMLDNIFSAKKILKERMAGVVINSIPNDKIELVKERITPYLEKEKIPVLGAIPYDCILASASVRELKENLEAEVICAADKIDNLVKNFCIGAMYPEAALKYFRQIPDKAVITGGDRTDIQLAALETSTICLILTGNIYPSAIVVSKAESLGIPLLVVKSDTFSIIEKIETMLGKLPVQGEKKIKRAEELLDNYFNFDKFLNLTKS